MLVLTTDTLPSFMRITAIGGLVQSTHRIELSDKGLYRSFLDKGKNEHQEAYDRFIESAKNMGNVIYGVRVSTSIAQFKEGVFMFITHCGTIATYEMIAEGEFIELNVPAENITELTSMDLNDKESSLPNHSSNIVLLEEPSQPAEEPIDPIKKIEEMSIANQKDIDNLIKKQ